MSLWDTLFQHLKVKIEEACCSSIFCQLKGANVVSKSAYLEAVKWPQTSGISKCVIQNYVVLEQWLRGAEATLRRYHMSKGKEKPQQNGRRGEAAFRIKPHTCQRHSEGSNISCAHQDPEIPQRLRQNCVGMSPVEVQASSGLPQGQGLWVPQTWVWHKHSWRRLPLTPA